MREEFAPIFELVRAERLQLVEGLSDVIPKEEEHLPVPEWKRKERFSRHSSSGRTWDEVKQRARARYD